MALKHAKVAWQVVHGRASWARLPSCYYYGLYTGQPFDESRKIGATDKECSENGIKKICWKSFRSGKGDKKEWLFFQKRENIRRKNDEEKRLGGNKQPNQPSTAVIENVRGDENVDEWAHVSVEIEVMDKS